MSEQVLVFLAMALLLLALDVAAARWGENSWHEFKSRNW
jgi:hypothetical protein